MRSNFHEAVLDHAGRWFEGLEGALPTKYGRDPVLWIYVSYVFRRYDDFRKAPKRGGTAE
jgi:hypothetical protein